MKIKDPDLFRIFKEFLRTYLSKVRRKSSNTIASYRYAINLYLEYLQEKHKKSLKDVTVGDFNQAEIIGFLDWLENSRGNAVTTVNQRLSHIRSFCHYLVKNGKMDLIDLNNISEIVRIDDDRKTKLLYLSIEDVKMVLNQPDTSKKNGIRDEFYIALLYDSGCRNQEILDLKVKDFVIKKSGEAELHVIGKGNKHRVTPVTKDVVSLFERYSKIYHSDISNAQEQYLFYIIRKNASTQMSADNVQRFLRTYEKSAKQANPNLLHLHPHLFRRTRAMHLYMAGVPLPLVAEWLGHSSLETCQMYAQATMEMKRKAAEKLANDEHSVFKDDVTFKYADADEVLRKLSGLK
jgi:site-specific recombinase XerD